MSVRRVLETMWMRRTQSTVTDTTDPEGPQTGAPPSQSTKKVTVGTGTSPQDVFIAVMGSTGSGKSTQEVSIHHFSYDDNTKVHLIDTPGFDDSDKSDFHVLTEIAAFLQTSYQDGLKLNGIIYLYRITDNRLQGSHRRSMTIFHKMIGGNVYPNIILASTRWELEDLATGKAREASLIDQSDFWRKMRQEGCQIRRHMNTKGSAMDLVRYFVKQRTDKIVLDLQDDLVTENKKLAHTAAGKEVCGQLSEEVEKMKLQVEDAKLTLQEALRNHDKQAHERYKERVDWTKKLEKLQNDNRTSAQRMQRDFEEASKRHEAVIKGLMNARRELDESNSRTERKLAYQMTRQSESTSSWSLPIIQARRPQNRSNSPTGASYPVVATSSRPVWSPEVVQRKIPNPSPNRWSSQAEASFAAPFQSTSGALTASSSTASPQTPSLIQRTSRLQTGTLYDDPYDLDALIDRLLEARGSRPGTQVQLFDLEMRWLCQRAREVFLSQPALLELCAPLKILGDIRGQYYDLLRLFEIHGGFPPASNYLFLGNYVDGGKQSLETICLCLAYKIKYPEKFFMLRGIHETAAMNRIPECGLLCDLLWSDPDAAIRGWSENDRGISFTFGSDVVTRFCAKHDLDLIVRGHQCTPDGYEFFCDKELVTLWSAPNFVENCPNAAAILSITGDLMVSFQVGMSDS
ncbi:MAG: hypothetical protein Q9199_003812 [Rusavskia elegans]